MLFFSLKSFTAALKLIEHGPDYIKRLIDGAKAFIKATKKVQKEKNKRLKQIKEMEKAKSSQTK